MEDKAQNTTTQAIFREEKAFRQLFDAYFERIHILCLRYIRNNSLAEETAMDTMFLIWRNRQRIDEIDNQDAYIFRIAHNAIISTIRKKHTSFQSLEEIGEPALPSTDRSPYYDLQLKELQNVYNEAVASLPRKRREIFRMHREMQLSYTAIASRLNISPRTVEHQVASALQTIQKAMKEYGVHVIMVAIASAV